MLQNSNSELSIFANEAQNGLGEVLHHVFCLGLGFLEVGPHLYLTVFGIWVEAAVWFLEKLSFICCSLFDIVFPLNYFDVVSGFGGAAIDGWAGSLSLLMIEFSVAGDGRVFVEASGAAAWAGVSFVEFIVECILFLE